MAKLNVSNQQSPENPYVVAIFGSLGVLMCMIVTVMGIKLWWFKHRLNFEQTTIQNGAAGGVTPNVVVTRREKKSRFSKDKRWSQQIYESVEVHGVFKQKKEDDLEIDIERTPQLPPVRLRQAESLPSLLLPPPRTKRRPQYVQSTAFEELEVEEDTKLDDGRETYGQLSSSNAAEIVDNAPQISLTFAEVEQELKPKLLEKEDNQIATEIAETTKRLNRSSSAAIKQQRNEEKPQRFLKASQSISVPEFHKVIERRPTGFNRPAIDDLTKIDDLEEQPFEKFGDRRPTGYIKYEEVDFQTDLRDCRNVNGSNHYEEVKNFYDSGHLEHQTIEPIEALRNEEIIYQNPETPDICDINKSIEIYEKSEKDKAKESRSYQQNVESKNVQKDFLYNGRQKESYHKNSENNFEQVYLNSAQVIKQNQNAKQSYPKRDIGKYAEMENLVNDDYGNSEKSFQTLNARNVSFEANDAEDIEKSTLNQRRPTEFVRQLPNEAIDNLEIENIKPSRSSGEMESPELYADVKTIRQASNTDGNTTTKLNRDNNDSKHLEEFEQILNLDQRNANELIKLEFETKVQDSKAPNVTFNIKDQMYENEEKFSLNRRRPTAYPSSGPKENEKTDMELSHQTVRFDIQENPQQLEGEDEKFTLNQRRPTSFVNSRLSENEEETQEFQQQSVRFDLMGNQENKGTEDKFTLNQRRSTAYIRDELGEKEKYTESELQAIRFDFETSSSDDQDQFTSNQSTATAYHSKVQFENVAEAGEDDKFTLNQRRLTKYSNRNGEQLDEQSMDIVNNLDLKQNHVFETMAKASPSSYKENLFKNAPQIPISNQGIAMPNNISKQTQFKDVVDGNTTYTQTLKTPIANQGISIPNNLHKQAQFKDHDVVDNGSNALKFQTSSALKISHDQDAVWQELEKDIQYDFAQNIEEEFARIRQSFESNEADFLELQLSPITSIQPTFDSNQTSAYGKSIEDDWENFENLKSDAENLHESILEENHEICITYNKETMEPDIATVSILKETKVNEAPQAESNREIKPRKSKVTFDSKTEEHEIPARRTISDEEYSDNHEEDDDDDEYMSNESMPPIPMRRLTTLRYTEDSFYEPIVTPPTTISLFGSQVSQEDEPEIEDSWSAIRKHRNLTAQFQTLTLDSASSPPPPTYPPPPLPTSRTKESMAAPKPAYRNPMAQLAVQKAKEVRNDMEGFKARSIKDAKKSQEKRSSQEFINLRNDFNDDTEA